MVVVEVCGDLTLLSAGGSLLVYDHSSAKSRVINIFTENNNNNNNSAKTEEDEEEEEGEEEGGGGGGDINGKKKETGNKDESEGRKKKNNKELEKKNEKNDKEEKKHDKSDTGSQSITAAKFSPCGRWLVVGGGWKAVEVWSVADWVRLASHTLPKRPTALAVTADSSCVLVADRAGDVYKFPLNTTTTTTTSTTTASPPKPLLGHLSMLLDVATTPDGRYIVTCDRDEKVRLTHLAHTCLIHTFLLGHLEFVTCLAVLSADPPRLLSCSGDGTIRLWDYEEGVCLSTLDLSPHVSPLPLPPPSLSMEAGGGEGKGSSTPPQPPTSPPAAAATAVKKIAVISFSSSSSSSSSSYLVAALVYRAKEVVLCRVEDTHLHVISTTALKGEPLGGAWRRRRRRTEGEGGGGGGGGGGGEELILVVEDSSGGGGGVVVMEVVEDKLVEVEEEEEEKKEEEEEEERSTTLGRRYHHVLQGLSTPPDSSEVELAFLYKQKYDNVGEYMKKKRERERLTEEGVRLTKRGRWAR